MGKRAFIWVLIILLIIIGVILVLIIIQSGSFSPVSINLEECNSLKIGGEGEVDIVFFADSEKIAMKYIDYFLDLKPFNNFAEKFNFYYLPDYKPECELYKGIALLCYSRKLVQKAGSCPNDYIVVLNGDEDRNIRSSNYVNVMSINTNHPLSVFAHEFGHAFVFLAEEYVPAKIPRNAAGNCVSECKEFEDREDGCYEGCSEDDYTRSIESGVMRTLKTDVYGSFNEFLIIDKITEGNFEKNSDGSGEISRAPFGFSPEECLGENYYLIDGEYKEGEIKILERSFEKGCASYGGVGAFKFNYILDEGKKLVGDEFNPEVVFTSGPDDEDGIDGEVYDYEGKFYLKVPIVRGVKSMEIEDIDNGVVEIVELYDIGGRACLVE